MYLPERKSTLIAYLRMKVDEQDWHGVADAAMDLRELEIEIKNESKINRTIQAPQRSLEDPYPDLGASNAGQKTRRD